MCPYMKCDSSPKLYSSPLWSHVNELCVLKLLLWRRYAVSSVILCSACQHASLTVLVLFRYSCYISHVLSLGPILSLKKKYHLHKKDYVLSKPPPPRDIRIWCTNRCNPDAEGMHTYCTLSCQQHSFHPPPIAPPWERAFFSDGGVGDFMPEQASTDMSPIWGVHDWDMSPPKLSIFPVIAPVQSRLGGDKMQGSRLTSELLWWSSGSP